MHDHSFFLLEIKVDCIKIKSLVRRLGYNFEMTLPAKGFARGLCLFWKDGNGIDLEVLFQTKCHQCFSFSEPINRPWMLNVFYGPPMATCKASSRASLHAIASSFMR